MVGLRPAIRPAKYSALQDKLDDGVKLIVGLGNPGIEYQFTPHNIGFLAVDRIAERCGVVVDNRHCKALTARTRIGNDERSEEHTSELQSLAYLVCRLLLEKKKR